MKEEEQRGVWLMTRKEKQCLEEKDRRIEKEQGRGQKMEARKELWN